MFQKKISIKLTLTHVQFSYRSYDIFSLNNQQSTIKTLGLLTFIQHYRNTIEYINKNIRTIESRLPPHIVQNKQSKHPQPHNADVILSIYRNLSLNVIGSKFVKIFRYISLAIYRIFQSVLFYIKKLINTYLAHNRDWWHRQSPDYCSDHSRSR